MFFAVIQCFVEPIQILFVAGMTVKHHGGDEDLVMRPPKLHVMLVCFGGHTHAIHKVQQTAVFVVPTCFYGPVEDLSGFCYQRFVACAFGMFQQEPYAFNVMTGIDDAAFGEIGADLPVGAHIFQHAFQFWLHKILEDLVYALLRAGFIFGHVFRIDPKQNANDIEDDHGKAKGTAGAGLGNGFGPCVYGVFSAVGKIPVEVVCSAGPGKAFLITGDAVVFGIGGTYGAMPELYIKLYELVKKGDMNMALAIQNDCCRIIYKMCSAQGNLYAVIKEILRRLEGIDCGSVRAPLAPLAEGYSGIVEECVEMIRAALAKYC